MAQWSEFDLERAVWTVPALRVKMSRLHRVPLPRQARELLGTLRLKSKGNLLFPGVRSQSRPMSYSTLNAALRRRGFTKDQAKGHGFRATASTLLNELITPRMHGIHQSVVPAERDSNWSSGISIWDRLHGTFRATPPPHAVIIGIEDDFAAAEMPISGALSAPFRQHLAGS